MTKNEKQVHRAISLLTVVYTDTALQSYNLFLPLRSLSLLHL